MIIEFKEIFPKEKGNDERTHEILILKENKLNGRKITVMITNSSGMMLIN